jgi:invasion protein IalB
MNKMTERLVVGGIALLIGLALGWMAHGLAGYSMDTETITNKQDWRVACPPASAKAQNCELIQDVLDNNTHNEVASFAIAHDGGKQVAGITLPLGVALQPGVGLKFGTDAVQVIQYRTCSPRGCLAEVPLDGKLQASLNAGKDGQILFAGLDNKAVAIPLSLKGFAEAQKLYLSNEAKRGSWFWRMF